MKKQTIFFITALILTLIFTGFSLKDVQANAGWSPKATCNDALNTSEQYYGDKGSFYNADTEECWMRFNNGQVANQCFPNYDVNKPVYHEPTDGSAPYWTWEFSGCSQQPVQ